jgi:hypothetical protein
VGLANHNSDSLITTSGKWLIAKNLPAYYVIFDSKEAPDGDLRRSAIAE